MSTVKYGQQRLKKTIIQQTINSKKFHYSICNKQATHLSFFSKQRLLIFDETVGCIFYINELNCVPFEKEQNLPRPKNDVAFINLSVIKTLPKTSTISIQFNKKNDKKETVSGEWNFTMDNMNLAKQWIELIRDVKQKKTTAALGLDPKNKQGANMISDTLAFGMLGSKKQINSDPTQKEEEVRMQSFFMSFNDPEKSKAENIDKKQPSKQISKSQLKQDPLNNNSFQPTTSKYQPQNKQSNISRQSSPNNIRISNVNQSKINQSNTNQNAVKQSGVNQSNINKSAVNSSNINQSNIKQSIISQNDIKKSNINQSQIRKNSPNNSSLKNQNKQGSKFLIQNNANSNLGQLKKSNRPDIKSNTQTKYQEGDDWNYLFLQEYSEKIIKQFEKSAIKTFTNIRQNQLQINQQNPLLFIEKNGLLFYISKALTLQSNQLKNQFKNYHYIIESNFKNPIIHVPLCCIIQYLGWVCLVKAPLSNSKSQITNPKDVQHIIKKLEPLTKISRETLNRNCELWDLSGAYGSSGNNQPVIYIDELRECLPLLEDQITAIRPQLIDSSIKAPLDYDSPTTLQTINKKQHQSIKAVADLLSEQEVVISHYSQLKQFLHTFGLNVNSLPKIYGELKSRQAKKIIQTTMVAKLIKKQILTTYTDLTHQQTDKAIDITFSLLKCYCEGDHPNREQAWKNIAMEFRKNYKFSMNPHELEKGYLLSTILALLSIDCDTKKIDKDKILFQGSNIFEHGFIKNIKIKTKIYNKFISTQIQQALMMAANGQESIQNISQLMKLSQPEQDKTNNILSQHNRYKFYSNMSKHSSYFSSNYRNNLNTTIHSLINSQPPFIFTHQITMRYLDYCLESNQIKQYKQTINLSMDILAYWFGQDHLFLCDTYQSLSNFYMQQQNHEDSINFMKLALTTCIKSGGTHTRMAGIKYYQLGSKQVMFGFKNQAFQSFTKAKINMESFQYYGLQYIMLLNKVATLHLNKGEVTNCIGMTIKALQKAESLEIEDSILIKNYLLLCRAYEINGAKQQLENLMHLCAKVFNNTQDPYTMDQMIRICITCCVLTMSESRKHHLSQYIQHNRNQLLDSSDPEYRIKQLMLKAHSCLIIEKFISKISQLERTIHELKNNRGQSLQTKQTRWFVDNVTGVVGVDFVEGILMQAEYL